MSGHLDTIYQYKRRQLPLPDIVYDSSYDKYFIYFNFLPKRINNFVTAQKYIKYNLQMNRHSISSLLKYKNEQFITEAMEVYHNTIDTSVYKYIISQGNINTLRNYIRMGLTPVYEIGYVYVLRAKHKNRLAMLKILYENNCSLMLCSVIEVLNTRNKEIIEYMFSIGVNDASIADIYALKCQDLGLNLETMPLSLYAVLYGYDKTTYHVEKLVYIEIMNLIYYDKKTFDLIVCDDDEKVIDIKDITNATTCVKLQLFMREKLKCGLLEILRLRWS